MSISVINFVSSGRIKDGKLILSQSQIDQYTKNCLDAEVIVKVEEIRDPKSYEQIKVFHGTILDQVRECHMENEGEVISKDKLKSMLKNEFLEKIPQYWSDGTQVVQMVEHPDRKGVFFQIPVKVTPSLSKLTKEQMTEFISKIIDHYWQNYGWSITIRE